MAVFSLRELSDQLVTELRLAGFASHEKIFFSFSTGLGDNRPRAPRRVFDFFLHVAGALLSDPEVRIIFIDWLEDLPWIPFGGNKNPPPMPGTAFAARIRLDHENSVFDFPGFMDRHSLVLHLKKAGGKFLLGSGWIVLYFPLPRGEAGRALHREKLLAEIKDRRACQELIECFISHTEGLLCELEEKLRRKDSLSVRGIAHSLKGSALSFFAEGIHDLASELEKRAYDGILERGGEYLEELRREYAEICSYFKASPVWNNEMD
jgi:HPt (histidine-containing phosphotransfer) domain-containing protein